MTRITVGELKRAIRNPGERRTPRGDRPPIVTPYSMANSAVRRYHREGPLAATRYLERRLQQSDYWGPGGRANARSWAANILEYFAMYVDMAEGDDRPHVDMTLRADVAIQGGNEVGVTLDVVLLDRYGYCGRLPLWDRTPLIDAHAEVLAAPLVVAVEEQLGQGRSTGLEFWHLPSGTETVVERGTAMDALSRVPTVVSRYLG